MGSTADDLAVDGLEPDTALLIIGPPMTGKYQLMLRLLARQSDSVILVTTRNDAETIREDYRTVAGQVPDERIGIIDCASRRGAAEEGEAESGTVQYVGSPGNLTTIGVRFTDLFGRFHDDPDAGHVGVGLHSLSQLLMHTNVKQAYQFLQVLTGQIRSVGWFHAAVIDSSVVDEGDERVLQHHFDGVIETRENDDGQREFRARGLTATASPWQPF